MEKCVCPRARVLRGWGSLSSNADTKPDVGSLVPLKNGNFYVMVTG